VKRDGIEVQVFCHLTEYFDNFQKLSFSTVILAFLNTDFAHVLSSFFINKRYFYS